MDSPALLYTMNELYPTFFTQANTIEQIDPNSTEIALCAYEQAITLAPRAAVLHYHKGQVLEQLGRNTEAQTAYAVARHLGYQC